MQDFRIFSPTTEAINGRAAMLGFAVAVLSEIATGEMTAVADAHVAVVAHSHDCMHEGAVTDCNRTASPSSDQAASPASHRLL